MSEIINCAAYADGRRIADVELNKVHEVLKDAGQFVWIGLHEPTEQVLEIVQREFDLHDLAIEDAHHTHQRPKVELYGDSVFIVLRTAQINNDNHIEFGETHFFVGTNFFVSVRHGSSVPYTEVRSRSEAAPDLLSKGPGFVLYAVMDFIVDRYFPVVQDMEQDLVAIEEKIFKAKPSRETTEQIYQLKRELLDVKRAVSPLVDVCNSALEANFSLISISQNDTSKKFAGWAAIIAVPTMVAGFWGMNFKFMPETEWKYGFHAVIVFTIIACTLLYFLFKRSGWL